MVADLIPEIFRPVADVFENQLIDVLTPAAEQSDHIGRSVAPLMRGFPAGPICRLNERAGGAILFARGCSRESDELLNYLHWARPAI